MATCSKFGSSVLDASDAFYDFTCSPCLDDGKNVEAFYHCAVCQMYYCQSCKDTHNRFTKNHTLLDRSSDKFGQTSKLQTIATSSELPADTCEEHHGEVVKMYCGQHDIVCCTVCIQVNHSSCKGVEYIPKIAHRLLQGNKRNQTKASLKKVKADLQIRKQKFQDELTQLSQERDDIIDDIQQFKRNIIAKVEELEKKSLTDLQTTYQRLTEVISSFHLKTDEVLSAVDQRLKKLDQPLKDNAAQAVVDIKYAEQTCIQGHELTKRCREKRETRMEFKKHADFETSLSKMVSLGTVKVSVMPYPVNIVCSAVVRDNDLVDSFIRFLQETLRHSFNIESEYIQRDEVSKDRYTVIVYECFGAGSRSRALQGISNENHPMLITMRLVEKRYSIDLNNLVWDLMIGVKHPCVIYTKEDDLYSFKSDRNKEAFESLAKFLKPILI